MQALETELLRLLAVAERDRAAFARRQALGGVEGEARRVRDLGGPNAVAVTLEADGTGAIFPVLYTRIEGEIRERAMLADPLLRYDGPDTRREILAIVREAIPEVPTD